MQRTGEAAVAAAAHPPSSPVRRTPGGCFNCDSTDHQSHSCPHPKNNNHTMNKAKPFTNNNNQNNMGSSNTPFGASNPRKPPPAKSACPTDTIRDAGSIELCSQCFRPGHSRAACWLLTKHCDKCNRWGHDWEICQKNPNKKNFNNRSNHISALKLNNVMIADNNCRALSANMVTAGTNQLCIRLGGIGEVHPAMLDSGSQISIVSYEYLQRTNQLEHIDPPKANEPQFIRLANGSRVKRIGVFRGPVTVFFMGQEKENRKAHECVSKGLEVMAGMNYIYIIGMDLIPRLFPGNEMLKYMITASNITDSPQCQRLEYEDGSSEAEGPARHGWREIPVKGTEMEGGGWGPITLRCGPAIAEEEVRSKHPNFFSSAAAVPPSSLSSSSSSSSAAVVVEDENENEN